MSKVVFIISAGNILGGLPQGWPLKASSFIKEVELTAPPPAGMVVNLSIEYDTSMDAEIDDVKYFLEQDTYHVTLEMHRENIDMDYFLDKDHGWST